MTPDAHPERRREWVRALAEAELVQPALGDRARVHVWRLQRDRDHGGDVLVEQLAAEGLALEDRAHLRGEQVLLLPADVDQRQVGVLQSDVVL